MTRRDTLQCIHEPFGDAFYYGPELMSERFKDDAAAREASGLSHRTYKNTLDEFQEAQQEVSLPPLRMISCCGT
jgi:hypothetical protein